MVEERECEREREKEREREREREREGGRERERKEEREREITTAPNDAIINIYLPHLFRGCGSFSSNLSQTMARIHTMVPMMNEGRTMNISLKGSSHRALMETL